MHKTQLKEQEIKMKCISGNNTNSDSFTDSFHLSHDRQLGSFLPSFILVTATLLNNNDREDAGHGSLYYGVFLS